MDLETFAHNYGMPWLRFVRRPRRTVRLKGCSTSGFALGSRQCELMRYLKYVDHVVASDVSMRRYRIPDSGVKK